MLCLDDPTSETDFNMFDEFFLIVYTVEMSLKIFSKGFILNKHSYLRSFWNWIDFTIVVTSYLPYVIDNNQSINISSLRILRVIRPLRAISFLDELKKIILTLIHAMPNFLNVMLIFFFFMFFFGICSLQLFSGLLKKRCFENETGFLLTQTFDTSYNGVLCGYDACPDNYSCGKFIESPYYDVVNFDNIFWSMSNIFQTFIVFFNLYYVARTFNYYGALFFFIFCSIVGAFLLFNLMISVISSAYQAEETKKKEKILSIPKKKFIMSLEEFRKKREINLEVKKKIELKILIDFNFDYETQSENDVLENMALRQQRNIVQQIEKISKEEKFEIFHHPKKNSKINNENEHTVSKWEKRYEKLFSGQIFLKKKQRKQLFYNRKRINLPLSISLNALKLKNPKLFSSKPGANMFSEQKTTFFTEKNKKTLKMKYQKTSDFEQNYWNYEKIAEIIEEEIIVIPKSKNQEPINEEIFLQIKVFFSL